MTYRPLEPGEIIQEGDEYRWVALGSLPTDEYASLPYRWVTTIRAGESVPVDAHSVVEYRRLVDLPVSKEYQTTKTYRDLKPGEIIQEGDEYRHGPYDSSEPHRWVPTVNAGEAVPDGVHVQVHYRRRKPVETAIESPDDWVTQDQVPVRPVLDKCWWGSDAPPVDSWWDPASGGGSHGMKHGDKHPMGHALNVACRRSDLPDPGEGWPKFFTYKDPTYFGYLYVASRDAKPLVHHISNKYAAPSVFSTDEVLRQVHTGVMIQVTGDEARKRLEPQVEWAPPEVRQFTTGATRNLDNNKLDYEGFLSPLAVHAFARYMHKHRKQKDGTLRASDNWQKGIPDDVYVKSAFRHFMDVWSMHHGIDMISPDDGEPVTMEDALCALLFNVQGMLHELIKRGDGDG